MRRLTYLFLLAVVILSGCNGTPQPLLPQGTLYPSEATLTPFQPLSTTTSEPILTTLVPLRLWLPAYLPEGLRRQIAEIPVEMANSETNANITLALGKPEEGIPWVYALVAPFPTIRDDISLQDLLRAWRDEANPLEGPIYVSPSTLEIMQNILGPAGQNVRVEDEAVLLESTWAARPAFAIIPFETLEPRWKVIRVEEQSPIDKHFDPQAYPLTAWFTWQGEASRIAEMENRLKTAGVTLHSNRDAEKLTVLVMTGVTALVRATAAKMEEKGVTYPARDVGDLLRDADLTHISNEVSFSPKCPPPNPNQTSLIFCSDPKYIELLDYVGTDILELTGNHGVDWGRDALLYSLDLYRQRGWAFFAAGENEAQAKAAVTVEHNSNRFAFIGCNPAGPAFIWATADLPGVANCDYPWMEAEIRRLKEAGYLVIATFQYFESYRPDVLPYEQQDFRRLADAGAVIVSGSQAHHPMAMEFYNGSFIHYGLGNLFFDQMHVYVNDRLIEGTRKGFIDQHVFYNGHHISTVLITTMLEDYARPRLMTPEERAAFLSQMFSVSGW
ncbi:CapA family protein [Thermanaerothrix sp. 4228-RoL]|uniref:CapA family protein n=2 Tax=Thermanaerothrix TaxID=1077886 RepID=A0ABU3NKN7_9CHLR|nr:CapA family protein [Thermanaerothrix sp. 4228-RoL]MDT8897419.1 CapA family protein [Thermanaerothrix sp. 4228-RoL]